VTGRREDCITDGKLLILVMALQARRPQLFSE
jgi:hypothetical protein